MSDVERPVVLTDEERSALVAGMNRLADNAIALRTKAIGTMTNTYTAREEMLKQANAEDKHVALLAAVVKRVKVAG